MKKKLDDGFMLIETLVVTSFVSGILLFLFIQFNILNKNYDDSYKYNNVDDLYAIRGVSDYLDTELLAINNVITAVNENGYSDITDCEVFAEKNYCLKLFELYNIKKIFITENFVDEELFFNYNDGLKNFISKISGEGKQRLRIIVEFNDSKYATLRYGDKNE